MGLLEYLWPFDKPFSKIPCAREASLIAVIGGSCLGGAYYMLTSKVGGTYRVALLGGANLLWISFTICHYNYRKSKKNQLLAQRNLISGIDS